LFDDKKDNQISETLIERKDKDQTPSKESNASFNEQTINSSCLSSCISSSCLSSCPSSSNTICHPQPTCQDQH